MTGKTHLIVGTGATLALLSLAGESVTLPAAAVALVSSLLPDIDEPNSLLLQKTMPKSALKAIKAVLAAVGLGFIVYSYFRSFFVPYSYGAGGLMIAACLINQRLFRQLLMAALGGWMIYIGSEAGPWWGAIGALLMVCAVLPHRGVTHSAYGVLIWGGVLYFASMQLGMPLWQAGVSAYSLHLLCDALTKHGIHPLPPFKLKWSIPLMSTGKFSGFLVESICIAITFVLIWTAFIAPMGAVAADLWTYVKAQAAAVVNDSY